MAITIDYSGASYIINVPKADLTPTGDPAIFELDVDWFRLELKDLEDDVIGQPFPDTHRHNTEVTLAGLVFSRVVEILAPYTITFEDGQYAINLVGANNNIADRTNVNQVSVRTNNSAGLVSVSTGSGLSTEEHDQLMKALTVAKFLGLK